MKFDVAIYYSKTADKFIERNSNLLTRVKLRELLENAVKKLNGVDINVDIQEMQGSKNKYYRLRKGKIRIIFAYERGIIHIVNVEEIGFRGDVYK